MRVAVGVCMRILILCLFVSARGKLVSERRSYRGEQETENVYLDIHICVCVCVISSKR